MEFYHDVLFSFLRSEVLCLAFGHWVKCYQFRWRGVRLWLTPYPKYCLSDYSIYRLRICTEDDKLIIFCIDIIWYCWRHFGARWSFKRYSSATSRCCLHDKGHFPSLSLILPSLLTDALFFWLLKNLYYYIISCIFYFFKLFVSVLSKMLKCIIIVEYAVTQSKV